MRITLHRILVYTCVTYHKAFRLVALCITNQSPPLPPASLLVIVIAINLILLMLTGIVHHHRLHPFAMYNLMAKYDVVNIYL